ncbi:hypothetical protein [Actinoplanes sp. NPDC051494]|uniref:hypothetical protein n=1 Tax=Actinoplanes sp. NPDC051494 TaxID=3363907 RepID=UPI003798199A
MDQMPDEAQTAVRTVARATTGYEGTIEDVYRRHRRRSRRHAVVSGLSAVVVLLGIGVAVRQIAEPRRVSGPAAAPATSIAPPAQRLLLPMVTGTYLVPDDTTVELDGNAVAELTPTGHLVKHAFVGREKWRSVVGLPSGGLVAAGRTELTVVGADGTTVVRRKTGGGDLIGADDENAYLWRQGVLREHRLADGGQRDLVSYPEPAAVDLAGDRLALVDRVNPCQTRVLSLADGRTVGGSALPLDGCTRITAVRLSPDGLKLAVAYETRGSRRLLVEQVATGMPLVSPYRTGTNEDRSVLAWQDDATVTAVDVPEGQENQQLRPLTIRVRS